MKVAIITFSNIRVTPYLKYYLNILKDKNCEIDVIVWDRKNENECLEGAKLITYNKALDDKKNKIVKFIYMGSYARFVKKSLATKKYDYVISLTTVLGFFLSDYLIKNYYKRYIIDIRDYSYEHISFYYKKMTKVLESSMLNIISSPSYKKFLPDKEYLVSHNMNFKDVGDFVFHVKKEKPLTIGFVGLIRYATEFKKVLLSIKNDDRFFFEFYGDGEDEYLLKKYCEENNIKNVMFNGKFLPEQKNHIYENVDIVYNCYGNDTINVKYALSNKLYEAFYYKKPILVNEFTSMEEYSGEISFSIHNYDTLADELYTWYIGLDGQYVNDYCESKLQQYIEENERTAFYISNNLI